MRRILAAVAAATILLAGCSSDGESPIETVAPGDPAVPEVVTGTPGEDLPAVEGEFGEAPIVTFPDSDPSDDLTVGVAIEGDGAEVESGDMLVTHYQVGVWGEEPVQSSFTSPTPAAFALDQLISGWRYGLLGTHVGDRVVLSIPSEWAYPEGNEQLGVEPGDVLVFVVDILDSRPGDEYVGEANSATGELPAGVTLSAEPGTPAIPLIAEDAPEPEDVDVYVVAEGTGAPIASGDAIVVAYGASTWSNAPYGSSWSSVTWDGESDPYGVQALIVLTIGAGSPFDDLEGVPVGSRVLFLFPGDEESSTESQAVLADVVTVY